jgi:serine/threonine-protein kinase
MEEVGRGGMAVVYRGYDQTLERQVAIKVLHAHLATDAESRARFQREARAVARLRHPHIIEIFDFADQEDGPSYIVTEFIEGETLKSFMENHKAFFPEIAVMIAIQLCEAVGHAHSLQIIHRDLKPENVMVDRHGALKLMDFGIAKVLDHEQHMTLTGSILGSPAHMAPELLEGKELDFRSDVFSIGTVLYWLATGQLPFTGKNPHQVLKAILEGRFPDPRKVNPAVGEPLAAVISRALAHDPQDRYPSASAMLSSLHELLADLDISDIDSELRFFFSEPSTYTRKLKQKVEEFLLRRGKQRLLQKKTALALQDFDRLLAMDPQNSQVLALVENIHRSRRLARRIAVGSAAIGTAGLLAVAIAFWPRIPYGVLDGGSSEAPPPADGGLRGSASAAA